MKYLRHDIARFFQELWLLAQGLDPSYTKDGFPRDMQPDPRAADDFERLKALDITAPEGVRGVYHTDGNVEYVAFGVECNVKHGD